MADYSISAEITADSSKFNKGVNNAEKSLKSFSKGLADNINKLGKNGLVGAMANVSLATGGVALALGAVVKVAKKVGQAVSECTQAYRVQYQAELALETAVKNNPYIDGTASNRLKAFASEMQSVTDIGDEQFLPMMAQLIATGRTEAETMDIIRVATDMSATGTMSFETAIQQLNGTINGNIGRLGMQNAELKNLTQEELKSGKAVEILGEKFKGLASATADTTKQLKNAIGDLKENLGKIFETALAPMRRYFTEVITNLNNSITKSRELKGAIKEVFTDEGINIDATTANMQIALNKVLEQQREATRNYAQYLSLYGEYIDEATDETARAYREQISDLNRQIKQLAEELNKRKRESDSEAKKRAEAEKQAEAEKTINDLKEKYLKLIAEQEAKWENIKTVTGEAVNDEEKLNFYQEQLVAIMTEAGGKITENNQYYKDQKAIIDEILERLGKTKDVIIQTDIEDSFISRISKAIKTVTEQLQEEAEDWTSVVNKFVKTFRNSFANAFKMLGENLVNAGYGYEQFASVALNALAEVLQAIGEQLSALAVLKLVQKDYADAVIASAGAVSAFVASGVISGVASQLGSTKTAIEEIGIASQQAGYSLENFNRRLQEIQSGITNTSSRLTTNISLFKEISDSSNTVADAFAKAVEQEKAMLDANEELQELYRQYEAKLKGEGNPFITEWDLAARIGNITQKLHDLQNLYQQYTAIAVTARYNMYKATKSTLDNLKAQEKYTQDEIQSYKDIYSAFSKLNEIRAKYNALSEEQRKNLETEFNYFLIGGNVEKIADNLRYQLEQYQNFVNILLTEQKVNVQRLISDVYASLSEMGSSIGEHLMTSIVDGADKSDFLYSMKELIRENLLKLAVYTESFQNRLADIGAKLSLALLGGNSISSVRAELESLWEEASTRAKQAESVIESVFGDIQKKAKETVSSVKNTITSFAQAMENFKTSIQDLGGNIASNIVDGLTNGLAQSDFLQNMKQWIKKMLVQSVVYTNAMKAEIEAIGNAISRGITEGFTEDSFHAIRRDLSYIFTQANKTVTGIDNVLNSVFGGGYATGTDNATRGLHLVGEAGPELVRFRGGEQVLNAGRTQKVLAGGNSNTFNVNFTNVKDTSAYALVSQLKQYNRTMAINGIL